MSFAGTLSAVVKRKQHQGDRRFLLTAPNQIASFNFWQAWVGAAKKEQRTDEECGERKRVRSENRGSQQQAKSQGRSQGGRKTLPPSALVSAL